MRYLQQNLNNIFFTHYNSGETVGIIVTGQTSNDVSAYTMSTIISATTTYTIYSLPIYAPSYITSATTIMHLDIGKYNYEFGTIVTAATTTGYAIETLVEKDILTIENESGNTKPYTYTQPTTEINRIYYKKNS